MRRRLNLLPGIAFHLLISSLLALACEGIAAAGTATLEWAPANTTAYPRAGLSVVACRRKLILEWLTQARTAAAPLDPTLIDSNSIYTGTVFKSDTYLSNRALPAGGTAYFIQWMPMREPIQRESISRSELWSDGCLSGTTRAPLVLLNQRPRPRLRLTVNSPLPLLLQTLLLIFRSRLSSTRHPQPVRRSIGSGQWRAI
jgi:hypothetical protein